MSSISYFLNSSDKLPSQQHYTDYSHIRTSGSLRWWWGSKPSRAWAASFGKELHSEGCPTSSVPTNPRGQHCLIRRNHYDLSKRRYVYLRAIFTPLKEFAQQDCRLITTGKSLISFLTSCPRFSLIYSTTHLRTDLSKASQRWRHINTNI